MFPDVSPLSGDQVLDRLVPARTLEAAMKTAIPPGPAVSHPFPTEPKEFVLIHSDEATQAHEGEDWRTRTTSCRIRLGAAGALFVGILQLEPLVRTVLTGGH